MLVCHCHAVTDRDIREAVYQGASSVRAVGLVCGAGTGCGGCRELVECVVNECRAPRHSLVQLGRAEHVAEAG